MNDVDTQYLNRLIRILLVEDNPSDVRLMSAYLEDSDRQKVGLTVAGSLKSCFERLSQSSFDLILLDLNLPDTEGMDTLTRLLESRPETPIVILTGLSDQRIGIAAIKAGAQDFLVKGHQVAAVLERTIRYAMERHRLQRELRKLALRDDLTGLYNRRGFRFLGRQALEVSRRKRFPVTLLFIDVDDLKNINDRHGHAAGDTALKLTSDLIRQSYRASDVIDRIGGDEFAILALDCGPEAAEILRDRLMAAVTARAEREGLPFELRLSVGMVSRISVDDLEIRSLLSQADQAMYRRRAAEAQPGRLKQSLGNGPAGQGGRG